MTRIDDVQRAIAISFGVTLLLVPFVRRFAHGFGLIDVPNERSSHAVATPRTGGIAIMCGIVAALAVTGSLLATPLWQIIAAVLSLAALSLFDDVRPLPRHFRFFAQILVAGVILSVTHVVSRSIDLPFLGPVFVGVAAYPVAILWIVGVTNAFNFMDGINGIASLEAMICAVTLGFLMAWGGDVQGAVMAGAIAGAAAGFLPWNLRGSIFMGDVGSAGFGFLLSLLVLRASKVAPGVAAMLPLLPFLFDAGLTLVRRAARGERWFATPHRSHFYQRLAISGLGHLRVSLIYALLAILCSALALAYAQISDSQRVLGIMFLLLAHATVAAAAVFIDSRRKVAPV